MKLIVGLGNPGKEYENTRHNIGFKAIDAFAKNMNIQINKNKKSCKIYKGSNYILAKPQTYMNLSGDAVRALIKFYKIDIDNVLIIYDDMDLHIGRLRLKLSGSSGGQKGMMDIIDKLGTNQIKRLKIGIGRSHGNSKNYVLNHFSQTQLSKLNGIKKHVLDAIEYFLNDKFDLGMQNINSIENN